MADRKTRRAEARRARQKARRQRVSQGRARTRGPSVNAAARWPAREAWVGDAWHDATAILPAFALRQHDDGRSAWVAIEVDLSDGAFVRAEVGHGTDAQARAVLMSLTHPRDEGDERTLIQTAPATVARLWREARRVSVSVPEAAPDIERLLHDQHPDGADLDIRFGVDTPTDPGPTPRPPGLLQRAWRKLFGG